MPRVRGRSQRLRGRPQRLMYISCAGPVCVEKSVSISALIGDINDVRSSIFYRLGMAISVISDC